MLELPEAITLARQINENISGKRIVAATANHTPHKFAWYTGDPSDYSARLAGKTIGNAVAYGGHVAIAADDMTIIVSTALRWHRPDERLPKKHQLLLKLSDRSALTATIQMWGALLCVANGEDYGMFDIKAAMSKPSPLTAQFDQSYFSSLLHEGTANLSVKAFLATEQRIPGLGNGVLQDILWKAGIHPRRKVSTLSAKEKQNMYDAIKSVLQEMTHLGGRDTERDLFGNPGGYVTVLSKNTVGTACPVCGNRIKKETYLGGSIYFCGFCQA
jgi:formamidopyrimidine-DNA glycosylase